MILCVASQFLVLALRPNATLGDCFLLRAIVANFVLLWLMDRFLLPFLGIFLSLALFLSLIGSELWPSAMKILSFFFAGPLYFGAKIVSLAAMLFRTL